MRDMKGGTFGPVGVWLDIAGIANSAPTAPSPVCRLYGWEGKYPLPLPLPSTSLSLSLSLSLLALYLKLRKERSETQEE